MHWMTTSDYKKLFDAYLLATGCSLQPACGQTGKAWMDELLASEDGGSKKEGIKNAKYSIYQILTIKFFLIFTRNRL